MHTRDDNTSDDVFQGIRPVFVIKSLLVLKPIIQRSVAIIPYLLKYINNWHIS